MSTEFTREDRYIVFKLSDVERYLTDADMAYLAMMKNEIDAGRDCANKPPFKGLIVESDWPEYEPTWKAIEARVTGAQPAQKAVAYLDLGAGGYMDIGTDLNDEQLASLPKGRHMLGIVGTYGVDGYVSAQPAPSALAEAIIADMQAQHDSELITENDSGEALIRLDGAIAAVEDNFAQPAPSIPEGWKLVPIEPTHEMLDAGEDTFVPTYTGTPVSAPIDVYRAMLTAAPEAKP